VKNHTLSVRSRVRLILGIRGGDGPVTLQDLEDERARALTAIDDILDTARSRPEAERALTDIERTEHDQLEARITELDGEIEAARTTEGDAARFQRQDARRAAIPVPMVNLGGEKPSATRSLDELLWATSEDVPAGSFGRTGEFQQHATARNAVEQVAVRSDSGETVLAPRIDEFLPEHRPAVRAFQRTVADMAIFGLLVDKSAHSSADGFEAARSHPAMRGRWEAICRAMDVDTSGEGGTWVPTGIGADMHEKVRASGKVAALFPRIDLPTNPWKWPIEGADATAYRVAEPTSDTESKMTASTPGTLAATFDAEIFGARALFSRSLEADSAVAILPFAKRKLVQAFVDGEEKAILDGDTDGTHQDSDIGASTTAAVTAWDGLRKKAQAQAATATTTTTVANLATVRKSMKKWGINPADLAFIIGVSSYGVILSDSNVLTVDKMGPNATILNGMIGTLFGVPLIVSEWVREDLNASGVYDGITTTKTYALCVNRQEWAMGQRMALDVEVDDSIYRETYQRVLVGFMREDFQSITDTASNKDTAIGYNITSGS
jgi:HK97 family phage major capsid protein